MKGWKVQKKHWFPLAEVKLMAKLEPILAVQRMIKYVAACFIQFHYKVHFRVEKRKKEAKKKKKLAAKGKGKKKKSSK